ncbi:MAG: NifU family protein [Wolbachia endosymbiont of Xenopsylla cheopis]
MFIQIEDTPNPNTLKFLPGFPILKEGETAEFSQGNDVSNSKLARSLLQVEYVNNVFFGYDFITVTKSDEISWDLIKVEILTSIMDHFTTGGTALDNGDIRPADEDDEFYDEHDEEIVGRIKELIENYVRPAVAQDGGDIRFKGFKDGIVFFKLHGACSGCPSASLTLKQGVQNMLTYHIPEVAGVENI